MQVSYVKFYQPVQIGLHQEQTLGTKLSKNKDVQMYYENGLLKIVSASLKEEVYVPFSNIMCFHAAGEGKDEKKGKK